MNPAPITIPFRAGKQAFTAGVGITGNPYVWPRADEGDWMWQEWREGWHEAQLDAELAEIEKKK